MYNPECYTWMPTHNYNNQQNVKRKYDIWYILYIYISCVKQSYKEKISFHKTQFFNLRFPWTEKLTHHHRWYWTIQVLDTENACKAEWSEWLGKEIVYWGISLEIKIQMSVFLTVQSKWKAWIYVVDKSAVRQSIKKRH